MSEPLYGAFAFQGKKETLEEIKKLIDKAYEESQYLSKARNDEERGRIQLEMDQEETAEGLGKNRVYKSDMVLLMEFIGREPPYELNPQFIREGSLDKVVHFDHDTEGNLILLIESSGLKYNPLMEFHKLSKKYKGVKYSYRIDRGEDGWLMDVDGLCFPETYRIDVNGPNGSEDKFFEDYGEALSCISELIGEEMTGIEDVEDWNENNEEDGYWAHMYEYQEESDGVYLNIDMSSTAAELKREFKELTGGTLRIYDGSRRAYDGQKLENLLEIDANLPYERSSIHVWLDDYMTASQFENQMKKEYGLKVRVANENDWVKVPPEMPLGRLMDVDIPENPTYEQLVELSLQ